jgi:hypothetical protein
MLTWLSRPIRRFSQQDRGSVAIEAVILIPLLIWVFLALYATFHTYRTHMVNQKAAYTIGDMVSRETYPLDQAYLTGTRSFFAFLTGANSADLSVRLTVVFYDEETDTYQMDWSKAIGVSPVTEEDVLGWADALPTLLDQDRITVVETFHNYDPPFNTNLTTHTVANFVFTRPRYTPQILWED